MPRSSQRASAAASRPAGGVPSPRFERRRKRRLRVAAGALGLSLLLLAVTLAGFVTMADAQSVRPPANAVTNATPDSTGMSDVPGKITERPARSEMWRYVGGDRGADEDGFTTTVSIPNKLSATLVQPYGEEWRLLRRGPLPEYGLIFPAGMIVLLALFYLIRGRIRISAGPSSVRIKRFGGIERFGHWILAVSFVTLALTGLNLLYGREYILPIIGHEAYSLTAWWGKWVHNNIAWAFMLGLILIFVMWVGRNIPHPRDLVWLMKGGGLFSEHSHPDAGKFNAGQKLIFWSVILLGASLSLSGIALLFPFQTGLMGKTFGFFHDIGLSLSFIGIDVSQPVTALQEMQYQTIWHAAVALVMIAIVIAHIYIGTLGMEGAFDAMGSGDVDLNWAREHHNLWVDEVSARTSRRTPAE
ncbi:formate dehydrogenase subunit gamma [Paroceanicella profunda]|uniref:Formate dehydrogenase subunit gamma n=1 Tax=Paroceanicella profunda TaxID=2579971 RepID=A0A5B8G089_9RHOB|nr:formate dehydrogenase subunit gamma [Paroceanicella profunda]QDL92432.1 formate dehydrogenase subunit gamma [Paroceanicella profunda]